MTPIPSLICGDTHHLAEYCSSYLCHSNINGCGCVMMSLEVHKATNAAGIMCP